jgi:hypothetical protein
VNATVTDPEVATVQPNPSGDGGTLLAQSPGRTTVLLSYQRQTSAGGYFDVFNIADGLSRPVTVRVDVTVTA